MNKDKVKFNCPSCGGNQFTRRPDELLECKYCGTNWKHKEDGNIEAMGYKRCKCGQINTQNAIFCKRCQTRLRVDCPNCRSLIDLDAIYCSNCMINVEEGIKSKFAAEISEIETVIISKDAEIGRLNQYINRAKNVANKLCFWGKSGLTEEEQTIFSSLETNIGCLSPLLLNLLIIFVVDLFTSRILLNAGGYGNPEFSSLFTPKATNDLTTLLCLDLSISILLGRLISVSILRGIRMNRVDQYCEPYLQQISQNFDDKDTLKDDRERIQTEFEELLNKRSFETRNGSMIP